MVESIERQSITVTLNGKGYEWLEPTRVNARKMVRDLGEVNAAASKVPKQKRGKAKNDAFLEITTTFDAIEAMLEFFFKHNEAMEADRDHVSEADEVEIPQAFKEVTEFISAPFARLQKRNGELATPTS